LHAYFDGELDASSAAAFESHLKNCLECQSALAAEETLRHSIAQTNLYEPAPTNLRQSLAACLPSGPLAPARPPAMLTFGRWLVFAASMLLVAVLGWQLLGHFNSREPQDALVSAAVDAHLRSLQPGHLADVESTDQHTVKPWFDGKLDFAPPVRDLAADGFPLLGGRLDILEGKTVAALVYGRRKHIVNLFVWKAVSSGTSTNSGARQGYNWLEWQNGGFHFCTVSDVSPADLQQLRQLFLHQ
jgi:anti-sigma factor RsiW